MINGLAGSGRDPVGDGKMASYNALKQKVLADERQKKLDERARGSIRTRLQRLGRRKEKAFPNRSQL